MDRLLIFVVLHAVIVLNYSVDAARILGVFPVPSISHQVVFRALTNELAKQGHELVVVTPNPGLPKDRPKDNITEIDTSLSYEAIMEFFGRPEVRRGCVHLAEEMKEKDFIKMTELYDLIFGHPEMQALIQDKTQKFDLILVEGLSTAPLIFGKYYNAPVIWFSSFYGVTVNLEAMGVPSTHPIYAPEYMRTRYNHLSFWEKLHQIYVQYRLKSLIYKALPTELAIIKKYFKQYSGVSIEDLWNNVDLLFVNANPVFENNRPVPTNVVHLGALHMQPQKDLPQDLKTYLDSSKRGVVYFSLGTNVHFSFMDADLVDIFINATEALPYDVLWKVEEKDLPRVPENVKTSKWLPQRDLLHHPNIKAFITQGGLQSADETIDAGVPVVVLPMLGDQWYNGEQYERLGVGIKLDVLNLQSDELVNAVKTIIKDESYRSNMKKLGSIIRDQPQTPLQRAVWWCEYVIRHGGAKHLRSLSANVSWQEYLMLDVVVVVLVALLTVSFSVCLAVYSILNLIFASKGKSKKVKKN